MLQQQPETFHFPLGWTCSFINDLEGPKKKVCVSCLKDGQSIGTASVQVAGALFNCFGFWGRTVTIGGELKCLLLAPTAQLLALAGRQREKKNLSTGRKWTATDRPFILLLRFYKYSFAWRATNRMISFQLKKGNCFFFQFFFRNEIVQCWGCLEVILGLHLIITWIVRHLLPLFRNFQLKSLRKSNLFIFIKTGIEFKYGNAAPLWFQRRWRSENVGVRRHATRCHRPQVDPRRGSGDVQDAQVIHQQISLFASKLVIM